MAVQKWMYYYYYYRCKLFQWPHSIAAANQGLTHWNSSSCHLLTEPWGHRRWLSDASAHSPETIHHLHFPAASGLASPPRRSSFSCFRTEPLPLGLSDTGFLSARCSSCHPTNDVKAPNETMHRRQPLGIIADGDAGDASLAIFGETGKKCLISPKVWQHCYQTACRTDAYGATIRLWYKKDTETVKERQWHSPYFAWSMTSATMHF